MTGTSADDAPPPAAHSSAARRRAAGIYGTIVASAVLAGGGAHLQTVPLAIAVVVTLLVYWAAEGYAELLSEQIHGGHLPRMVALVVTVVLLVAHGWAAGRAAQLRGPRLLLVTLIAGALES
jgi:hypothetical protein